MILSLFLSHDGVEGKCAVGIRLLLSNFIYFFNIHLGLLSKACEYLLSLSYIVMYNVIKISLSTACKSLYDNNYEHCLMMLSIPLQCHINSSL